jgi:hypothetical protein
MRTAFKVLALSMGALCFAEEDCFDRCENAEAPAEVLAAACP